MGLDMYVFKCRKVSEDERKEFNGKLVSEITKKASLIPIEEYHENESMYKDLFPLMTRIQALDELFDYKRCCQAHNIKEDDVLWGRSYDGEKVEYSFKSGKKIVMSIEEYEEYFYTKLIWAYVWVSEEVCYWRKAYDLQDAVHENHLKKETAAYSKKHPEATQIPLNDLDIDNCGYYKLTMPERKKIVDLDHNDSHEAILLDSSVKNLFYHEWY